MPKAALDKLNAKGNQHAFTLSAELAADKNSIDADNRTVELAFSNEELAQRWYGYLRLDNSPDAIDSTRLNDRMAVLNNHDWDEQIGVVESWRIDTDRRGRAKVRFSKGAKADEIFQDIVDGIRGHVSVGFFIHEAYESGVHNDEPIYTVSKWEPYEISIVSVPALVGIGVGMKADGDEQPPIKLEEEEHFTMPNENIPAPAAPPAQELKQSPELSVAEALKAEKQRRDTLYAMGEQYGMKDLATQAVREDKSVEQFQAMMIEEYSKRQGEPTPVNNLSGVPAQAKKHFKSLGEQLQSVKLAAITSGRQTDQRLLNVNETFASGQSEGVGSEGGFLVQPTFLPEILRDMYQSGDILSRVRRVPMTTGNRLIINAVDETSRKDGKRNGGLQVKRTAEGQASTASKAKFRQLELKLKKMTGHYFATEELLADAAATTALVGMLFRDEFTFSIEEELFWGNGADEMLGIMNSGALITVNKETGQADGTVVADNVTKMYSRARVASIRNAVWYANQQILPQLQKMVIGDQPAYLPPGGLSQAPYGLLLGRPVVFTEHNEELGAKGDLIFADMSQYLYADKGEVDSASSVHVKFLEGEECFRFTIRNDGQPWHNAPITPARGSATTSPFVTLGARTS